MIIPSIMTSTIAFYLKNRYISSTTALGRVQYICFAAQLYCLGMLFTDFNHSVRNNDLGNKTSSSSWSNFRTGFSDIHLGRHVPTGDPFDHQHNIGTICGVNDFPRSPRPVHFLFCQHCRSAPKPEYVDPNSGWFDCVTTQGRHSGHRIHPILLHEIERFSFESSISEEDWAHGWGWMDLWHGCWRWKNTHWALCLSIGGEASIQSHQEDIYGTREMQFKWDSYSEVTDEHDDGKHNRYWQQNFL